MKRLLAALILLTSLVSLVASGPAAAQTDPACPPLPTRLAVGMTARVTPGEPNRLRASFSTSAEQIGTIPGGSTLTLVGGPQCLDGFRWWQVEFAGQTGWTVEGSEDTYFIEPELPSLRPVERWGYGIPRDVAWSPGYLAVASTAGVFIFDPADLSAAPRTLEPMDVWPTHLAADPSDPNRLAVLNGRQITLWDVASGTPLLQWTHGGASQADPVFSQDGTRLVTISGVQAFVWDAQTGDLIQTVGDEAAPVSTAALSPDGRQVFTGSRAGGLALRDVTSGAALRTDFRYNPALPLLSTMAVTFTPDGSGVVASDANGHIRYWSLVDTSRYLEYERPYQGDPNTPRALQIRFLSPDRFVTTEDSSTGGVRLWALDDGIRPLAAIDPSGFGGASRLAVSPDGAQLAVAMRYQDGYSVEIVGADPFAIVDRAGQFGSIDGFALSADGALLVTEGVGPQQVLNTEDGSRMMSLEMSDDLITGSAINADQTLITACASENAMSYDPVVLGWSIRESSAPMTLLDKFAFSSGGLCDQTFISGHTVGFLSYDGVYMERPDGFAPVLTESRRGRTYHALAGELGLFGHEATGFTIFNQAAPDTDQRVVTLPWQPTYEPTGVIVTALDAAGTRVARRSETVSAGVDVYDVSGSQAQFLFTAVNDVRLVSLAFSSEGRWLASGYEDGSILLWDVSAQRAVATLDGAEGLVFRLAFSPDSQRLYAASQDNVIDLWALDTLR